MSEADVSYKLEIGTSNMDKILATILLQNPEVEYIKEGIYHRFSPTSTIATDSGRAVVARLLDQMGNTVIAHGTVGMNGCDININNLDIQAGVNITLTSTTIFRRRDS